MTAEHVFQQLVVHHASEGRFYHTLDHIADVLDTINSLAGHAGSLPVVQLAAWFHDAIYDSRAADNEERSADLAASVLGGLGIGADIIANVRRLILLTRTHQADADDRDGQVLLDADLAILGTPAAEYARYAEAIRREYAWVPEQQYRQGRRAVLQRFLDRPRIYWTDLMYSRREAQARTNLAWEVTAL